ncbi:MAG: 16S rRNA (guanine(966)-N(2))-methyltransferase RsmD [Nitrospirota bacterium]
MRIIAGTLKGRKLFQPQGVNLRPTADKIREAVFNILAPNVPGAAFLDLYAGSGSIGIEAVSRGAKPVVLVEQEKQNVLLIRKNMTSLALTEKITLFHGSVLDFLKTNQATFDLVYVDPPYEDNDLLERLQTLGSFDTIRPEGIVVIEHFHKQEFPQDFGTLALSRQIRYGGTALTFYVKK